MVVARRLMRLAFVLVPLILPVPALAHASEGGFVLLLPTGVYALAGFAAVALTLVAALAVPADRLRQIFLPRPVLRAGARGRWPVASLLVTAVLGFALWHGVAGHQDPTENAAPLLIWSFGWLILPVAQSVFGDFWRVANPWVGIWRGLGGKTRAHYPRWLGRWPGLLTLLLLGAFLLADPAPAKPERLALFAAGYWALHMAGTLAFGPRWLFSAEAITLLLRAYAALSPLGRRHGRWRIGLPGWQVTHRHRRDLATAMFIVTALALGSFDGINETFWWLGRLGLNPLEFPGRSAVVAANLAGFAVAAILLPVMFVSCLAAGRILVGQGPGPLAAMRLFAPTLLPIALGYHVAHYLPSMLVEGQYLIIFLNDPLERGWHLLGLADPRVTTGFFNTIATVRMIYAAQAAAIVGGHALAILLAHRRALDLYDSAGRAHLSQMPLSLFMLGYTLLGLWLLATPRGV